MKAVFWILLVGLGQLAATEQTLFREVFVENREGVIDFNHYILRQFKEKPFLELVDEVLKNESLNDREIYEALHREIDKAKYSKFVQAHYTLQAFKALNRDISWQVAELMGKKPLKGYLEMGFNGSLCKPLKRSLSLSSPIYVLSDKESAIDNFESGSRAYDTWIPLNEYAPITEKDVPSESIDLFACYIGLHPIPQEKLKPFIASIYRTLRPGGSFLLLDHDASTEELRSLAHVAHSISNLATNVTPEENEREIRNFHGLDYWINLLKAQGFEYHTKQPLVRKGDSTKNSLIRFDKPLEGHERADIQLLSDLIKRYWQTFNKTQAPLRINNFSLVIFKESEKIHFLLEDPLETFKTLELERIAVIKTFPKNLFYLSSPRYKVFTHNLQQLASLPQAKILNIAGQTKIQLDLACPQSDSYSIEPCKKLYTIPVPNDTTKHYLVVEVEIPELLNALRKLPPQGVEILTIHDF